MRSFIKSTLMISRKTSAFTEGKYVKYAIKYICSMEKAMAMEKAKIDEKYTNGLKKDLGLP